MSWKPQIEVDGKWRGNGQAYQTHPEAMQSARREFQNWIYSTGWKVDESDQEPNFAWRNGNPVAIATKEQKS